MEGKRSVDGGAEAVSAEFDAFVTGVEPTLRRSLVAAYGPELGRDAAAEAFAWAWEHFDRVQEMEKPAGYLWRVAQTSVRRQWRRQKFEIDTSVVPEVLHGRAMAGGWDEELLASLRQLTVRQRVAVVLVHAYGYTLAEAADALGCSVSSLRNHLNRGLTRVRKTLDEGSDR